MNTLKLDEGSSINYTDKQWGGVTQMSTILLYLNKKLSANGGGVKNSQSPVNVVYERPYMRNTNSGKKQIHTLHTTLRKIYQETFLVGLTVIY